MVVSVITSFPPITYNQEDHQYRSDFHPLSSGIHPIAKILRVNLLEGDLQLAGLINGPTDLKSILSIRPSAEKATLTFFLPYAVCVVLHHRAKCRQLFSAVAKETV
jgi:hypothetical protein